MTGRERLLALLRREPTDRVPISTYELTIWGDHGWPRHEPSYQRLMAYVTEKTDALPLWGGYTPIYPKNLQIDTETWLEDPYTVTRKIYHTPKGDLTMVTKEEPSVKTSWTVEHLLKDEDDAEKFLSIPESDAAEIDVATFKQLDAEVGDRGLVLCDTGDPVGFVAGFFEMGEFTIMAMTEPEIIKALCDRVHKVIMHRLRAMLAAGCGPLYRIWGPEYCTPPYLPPSAFKEFVVPYVTEMIDLIHQYDCYARVHSHGNVRQILDMVVEMGADAIDPLEAPPDGDITLGEVKAKYGDKLILFGNMQLKYLEHETPAEIEARVKQAMDEAKEGGGFVLMPTAAPINIPLSPRTEENYFTYIDAGLKYGQY